MTNFTAVVSGSSSNNYFIYIYIYIMYVCVCIYVYNGTYDREKGSRDGDEGGGKRKKVKNVTFTNIV